MTKALRSNLDGTSFLECVSGPEKGKVCVLSSDEVSVGRTEDNALVLPNESVSRHHALFYTAGDGSICVQDKGSKNGILVNGDSVGDCALQDGDIVQIGQYVFRFNLENKVEPERQAAAEFDATDLARPVKVKNPAASRRIIMYTVLALVLGGVYYLNEQEGSVEPSKETEKSEKVDLTKKVPLPDAAELRGPKSTIPTLEDPALTRAEQALKKYDFDNQPILKAEQYFRRGQREYLSKNYQRAIRNFGTSISLDRKHPLATFYYRLADSEAKNIATDHFTIGRKYFEALQYSRAKYHFKQVLAMLSHLRTGDSHNKDHHLKKIQSEKYILQCEKRLRAAELFP